MTSPSQAAFNGGTSFTCQACGASFSTQDQLMQHNKMHMTSAPQEFKCSACGASFASQRELMDHNAKAHPM